jgi:hypothetical protein
MVLFFLIETIMMINDFKVSRLLIHFIGLFLITYLTKKNVMGLFTYNNIATFLIVTADVFLSRYFIKTYFDSNLDVLDAAHSILFVAISVFCIALVNFSDISELENSHIGNEHKDIITTALIYKIFSFYQLYYIDATDFSFLQYSLIEFVINNAFYLINTLINVFKNKNNILKSILFICKRIVFMMIVRIIFRHLYYKNDYFEDLINSVKHFLSSKFGLKDTLTIKGNYFNIFAYIAFTILELIN